jgi:fructokinase
MKKKRVIGIGETVLDILFKDDQPQKAVPGGSTFNSIVSLGRAGVPCAMVTEAGGDHIGDIICRFLQENGVSPEYVCRHENVKSHISLAFLDENNDAQYVFYKDHASVSLDGKLPTFGKDDMVLFGSFFAINPAIRPVVGGLLRAAREAGAWLYYDVNFRKNHIADLPDVMANIEENMRLADVVRGSREDFDYLYGLHDGDEIYSRVSQYCSKLILTDGARTIRVYSPDGCETYPVETIETVSTVGAGDNFNAGYIYAMIEMENGKWKGENGKLKVENSKSAPNNSQLSILNSQLIAMAQRWSRDVCCQIGNNISDELVARLKRDQPSAPNCMR